MAQCGWRPDKLPKGALSGSSGERPMQGNKRTIPVALAFASSADAPTELISP